MKPIPSLLSLFVALSCAAQTTVTIPAGGSTELTVLGYGSNTVTHVNGSVGTTAAITKAAVTNALELSGNAAKLFTAAATEVDQVSVTKTTVTNALALSGNASKIITAAATEVNAVLLVYKSSTVVNNTTSSASNNVVVASIPAATLGTNNSVRLRAFGDLLCNPGSQTNLTLTVTYGTTKMWEGIVSVAATAVRRPWVLDVTLSGVNSDSSQVLNGSFMSAHTGANSGTGEGAMIQTASSSGLMALLEGVATEDSKASKNLLVATTWASASASCEFKVQRAEVTAQ